MAGKAQLPGSVRTVLHGYIGCRNRAELISVSLSKDTKVAVEVAVGRIGPLKAGEASTNVTRTTVDLLKSVPQADRVYLEQMMFAAYCSAIRDSKALSEVEKGQAVLAYRREIHRAMSVQDKRPSGSKATESTSQDTSSQQKREKELTRKAILQDFFDYENQRRVIGSSEFFRVNAPLRYRAWLSEANDGNAMAQVLVGRSLLLGQGVAANPTESISWFQKAADLGNAAGLFNCGYAFNEGLGVEENKATALIYFRAAQKLHHPGAIAQIGRYYRFGLAGLAQNSQEAVTLFEQATKLGEVQALYDLGLIYDISAPNLPANPSRANEFFKKAADLGHQSARGLLASRSLAQAIERYTRTGVTPAERTSAVASAQAALRDLSPVEAYALIDALGSGQMQTAIETVAERGADDPMDKQIKEAINIMILKFRAADKDSRTQLMSRFNALSHNTMVSLAASGRHREVLDACREIFRQVDLVLLIKGEQDRTVKQIANCATSMLVLGYRRDAIELTDQAFALVDKIGSAKPWDWYLYDAVRNLGWNVGSALAEVGEKAKSQDYLKRAWDSAFVLFGQDQMIGRYSVLPIKGQIPAGVQSEDREFFEKFASDTSKKEGSGMSRFTIPTDFDGKKYPFHVYIVSGKNGYRQLQDQFVWVAEYRGGNVPGEVVASFHRLNAIATQNSVDFRELCVYAMGSANSDGDKGTTKSP